MNISIGIASDIDDVPKNKIIDLDILFLSKKIEKSSIDIEWLMRTNPETYFIDGKYCYHEQRKSETKHSFKKIGCTNILETTMVSTDFDFVKNSMYLPERYSIAFVSSSHKDSYIKRSLLISYAYINNCYVVSCNDTGLSYCFNSKGECIFGEYEEYPSVVQINLHSIRKDKIEGINN